MRLLSMLMIAIALTSGCATRPPESALAGEPIADEIALLRGRFVSGAQPDGNTLLLRGPEGLLVVDSGRHAQHSARILDAARASGAPVVAIVNTHWHLDHVAGNVPLRAAFPQARVHAGDAIDAALQGFLADYRAQLVQLLKAQPDSEAAAGWREEIARIDAGAQLRPTDAVTANTERTLAGRRVQLGLERNAVSGGDVWLLDRATGTLAAGDLVTLPVPLLDTACPEGWRQALARLDTLDFATLVPGHGAAMSHAQFREYRRAFDRLLDCAASGAGIGQCRVGWLRDAGTLVPAEDVALANSLLDYYLGQVLRAPAGQRNRYCAAGVAS